MPHSNIAPQTRARAKRLRHEMTKAEAAMWNLLREFRPRGARFRRETPIGPYIADFAWLSARIIVEVDGDSHELREGPRHDAQRDGFLRSHGFAVLRFDNSDVTERPEWVFASIEKALGRRLRDEMAGRSEQER